MENEWKSYSLGEICSYSKERINIQDVTNKNYISTENMFPDKGGITEAATLPNVKSVSRYEKGDTLISNIRPYFKKIWFSNKIGGASNDVLVIKGKSEKVFNKYLYYFLTQDKFFDYVMGTSKGTKMPRGDKDAILKYDIKLPPLDEQKAIAKVLSDLDEKIGINNKINKKLEEMAQAIFKQWFVDFEFPNEEGKPYKSSGGEMVESELGMIPNGWEVIEFTDIMNISSGKRPTKKNNEKTSEFTIPLAGASSIMGYVKEYNYDEPILVIGRVGTHGVVQRFNGKVWASDNTLVITSTYHEFTYQILNRIDYSALNRGSTQPLITQTDIKKQKIVKAKCELLNEYEKITGDIFNTINNNNKEIDKLVLLRDTLLPKLMSGEIRVPVEN